MPAVMLDHLAIATARLADALPVLVGRLGGVPESGGPGDGFRWACWRYEGGGCIEALEPAGEGGFLHRFLATRGPGVHHVTFTVPDLDRACARAAGVGYRIVGRDDSDPDWRVAYLHPKEALGLVVQLAQASGRDKRRPWAVPAGPAPAPPPARVLGLRTRARSRERADAQWGRALGGRPVEGRAGAIRYRWPPSPMHVAVEIAPDADEGPVAIELGPAPHAGPHAGLPSGPVPPLGVAFVTGSGEI
jgi:catechol 2,3-dioxygenase-like lactoylglutathione lyase family enzyme